VNSADPLHILENVGGWVGPSKHNCHRIVFYWLDDDYVFRPCSATFRS